MAKAGGDRQVDGRPWWQTRDGAPDRRFGVVGLALVAHRHHGGLADVGLHRREQGGLVFGVAVAEALFFCGATTRRLRTLPSLLSGAFRSSSPRYRFQEPAVSATEAANSRCGRLRIMLMVAEGTPTPVWMPLAPRTMSMRSYRAVSNSWLVLLL